MHSERELRVEPRTGATRDARRFTQQALAEWHLDGAYEIMLVCHELVANALVHARTAVSVCLRHWPGHLRVEVTDGEPRPPQRPVIVDELSVSGRGIAIVAQLASRWGSTPVPGGKTVWAELVVPADAGLGETTACRPLSQGGTDWPWSPPPAAGPATPPRRPADTNSRWPSFAQPVNCAPGRV